MQHNRSPVTALSPLPDRAVICIDALLGAGLLLSETDMFTSWRTPDMQLVHF